MKQPETGLSSVYFAVRKKQKPAFCVVGKSQISLPGCISGENSALFINHYLKLFGTLCCIVTNITLSLIYQTEN
jgi:hypothetical protein